MDEDSHRQLHIVVVGPCAAGKTTLVHGLRACGFQQARLVAQEHSGVADLWKRRGRPDVLIFLDARVETINNRQQRSDWTPEYLGEQLYRLRGARAACDFYVPTDELTIEGVLESVMEFLSLQAGFVQTSD